MSDASASIVVLESTFDNDDGHQQFLRQMDTEDGAQQYLEEVCGCDFFGGVDGDDAEQVLELLDVEDVYYNQGLTVEPLSDYANCQKAPFVIVGGYKCADSVHRDADKSSHLQMISTKASFRYNNMLPATMLTQDPPSASQDAYKKPDSVDEDIVEVLGWQKSKDPPGAFKKSRDPPGASHDSSVVHNRGDDNPEIVPAVVTPYSSERIFPNCCAGSDTSCTSPDSFRSDSDDSFTHASSDRSVNVFDDNVVALRCHNSKNPPGVTFEYESFKGLKYPKRTATITSADLAIYNDVYLEDLREPDKCRNATSIGGITFMSKVTGSVLQLDQRDDAVMKDMKNNNPDRIKSIKSLEQLMVQKKKELEGRKSEIDEPVYHTFKSLLVSIESHATESSAPLDESTENKFKQMINKHWDWFIEPKATEKRKGPDAAIQEEGSEDLDANGDHLKNRQVDFAAQRSCRPPMHEARVDLEDRISSEVRIDLAERIDSRLLGVAIPGARPEFTEVFCENDGYGLFYLGTTRTQGLTYCDRAIDDQVQASLNSKNMVLDIPQVRKASDPIEIIDYKESSIIAMLQECDVTDTDDSGGVTSVSVETVHIDVRDTATSPTTKNESAKNIRSKYFPRFNKPFFKGVCTKYEGLKDT